MRRLVMLFVFIGAVLSLSVPLAAQQDTDPATPTVFLQVIDTEPPISAELGIEMPVVFYFDRDLACDTAQNAVEVSPRIDGTIACDGAVLTWTPTQPYAAATSYSFRLADALRGANGEAQAEPFTLTLNTIGALIVSNTLPADGSEIVQVDQRLTVIFNRPIVPLTMLSETDDFPNPVTITPAIEGTGEWLNSAVYLFTPEPNWTGGITYTVTVDQSLTALDGAALDAPYSFSFTTIPPSVIDTRPLQDDNAFGLNAPIQFTFNQPIDRASFEENFMLSIDGVADVPITGTFEWTDDSTGVMYTHSEPLLVSTRYMYGFAADSVFEATGQTALPAFEQAFTTVGLPAIITTDPADGETAGPYGNIQIYFATRMNPETLTDKVTIEPEPRGEIDIYYREWETALSINFTAEPSTEYTVSIAPGMEDIYGNTIDAPFTFSFFTGPLDPSLVLVAPSGYVGFYDADRQPTEMFLTHRNVSKVDLSLYRIAMNDFIGTLNSSSYFDAFNTLSSSATDLLKAWTIPSIAPENVLRYERLNLSDFSEASVQGTAGIPACEGAPAARVKLGDIAQVITEPDPLRARSAPVDGEIVELLYRGYQFEIVGGPVCANGLYWWEVSLREDARGWVAEGTPDEYFFEVTIAAERTAFVLPQEFTDADSLPVGIYLLRASVPENAPYNSNTAEKFMVVGTANLTLKTTIDSTIVWATDIRSGQPLANVPLTLYATGKLEPQTAATDAEGIARFTMSRRDNVYEPVAVVLDDGENFGIGWSEWTDGIEPWWFNLQYNYYPQRYTIYTYTERTVYRPGQTVYFRGILREKDDVRYTVPDLATVPVRIFNNEGEEVYNNSLSLTDFGTFADSFVLDEDAGVGYYRIEVQLPIEAPFDGVSGGTAFDVAQYRVPEFEVSVSSDTDEYVSGDTIRYEVDTRYFFGGPVVNADVSYTVYTSGISFEYTGRGSYSFEDFDYERGYEFFYGDVIASGTGATDAEGKLVVEIPAELSQPYSQSFRLEATVMDSTGFAVSGRQSVNVRVSELHVGVAPSSYVVNVGEEATLDIITVDRDSAPVPEVRVNVEVFERRWSSVQRLDQTTGRVTYDSESEDIPVAEGVVTTDAEGRAMFAFTPPNGGVYRAVVTTTDLEGHTARAAAFLWVSSREPIAWRIENNNRVELIADRSSYEVGDTAEILIPSPFTGTAEALVTIERGDVMRVERVTIESNAYVHTVEITEDMAPNAYVSVFIVKGVDDQNPVAQFRMGMVNLNVDRSRKILNIALEADREFAGPGDTINYTVTTTDYTGAPVQAEVGVALTDLAVLSLGQEYNAPLLDVFYSVAGIGVRTASALTVNTDLLTQYTLDVIKGGGGGGGGDMGIYELREEFADTPYWNANLITDETGQATFSVMLPDNLTTWRLDARGITDSTSGDTLVGRETLDIVSTRPVLVRPAVPRFFVVGDEVRLGAVVNNNTDETLSVTVNMDATGVLQRSTEDAQTIDIEANSSARVWWDVTINDVEAVELIFYANANNGEYTDAARPRDAINGLLPVYKYEAPETVGTSGVLSDAGTRVENVVIPRRLNVTQGELSINVQASLASAVFDTLEALELDRCECLTLTAHKLMANAEAKRLLTETGSTDAALVAQLDSAVNLALQRIAANQRVEGGWSWYPQGDVDIYTSAQVVLALLTARDAGYSVDSGIVNAGVSYLLDNVRGLEYAPEFEVFVAYLLARAGEPNNALTSNLFDERALLIPRSKALLMMALPADDPRIAVLRDDLFADILMSANGAHWEASDNVVGWDTSVSNTAAALKALIKIEPQNELLPNVVRWLMIARRGDTWHTSQENAWVVSALTDWMIATGERDADYEYTVSVNDQTLVDDTFTPQTASESIFTALSVDALQTDAPNVIKLQRGEGEGALYYTAYLRAYLSVPTIPPVDRGLIVSRVYTQPGTTEPITEARVGELVQVRLTVIVPNEVFYVIVEDPLPAGVEAIDPMLQTSTQTETDPTFERQEDPSLFGWNWYYFSSIQFEDERVVLASQYLAPGTYEFVYTVRPSVEGVYNVIPPTASQYYLPEVFGRGAGSTFTVLPAQDAQD